MRIPRELRIYSFKDFYIRCNEIYEYFWENFAPFFDIVIYRNYLYDEAKLSATEFGQDKMAGIIWEYLMGDIDNEGLYYINASIRKEKRL